MPIQQHSKKIVKVMIVAVVIILLIGAIGYYFNHQRQQQMAQMAMGFQPDVWIETTERTDIQRIVAATGVVYLSDEQPVYGEDRLKVLDIKVDVGDYVTEGQQLVTYDVESARETLEQQIQEAEIALQNQRLNLQRLTVGPTNSEIQQLESNILTAKDAVERDKEAIETVQINIRLKQQDIETAQLEVDRADEEILRADEEILRADEEILRAEEDIERAEAEIIRADADVERAAEDIKRADEDIAKTEADINVSEQLLNVGAITREEHERVLETKNAAIRSKETVVRSHEAAIRSRESAVWAKENAVRAKENTVWARENTVWARENTVWSKAERERAKQAQVYALEELERQLESAHRTLEISERGVRMAEQALSERQKTLSTEAEKIDYQAQQNQIELSTLNLQNLQEQLDKIVADTVSPLNGTVTSVEVSKGSTVETTTILLKIANFQELVVTADISEYDAPLIALGQSVTMISDGIPDSVYNGSITKISNSATTQNAYSGTETVVPIEISVDNVDDYLRPGFNLECEIMTLDISDVIAVSRNSVMTDHETGESYVFVVNPDRILEQTPIMLGAEGDSLVEVIDGLSESMQVVGNPNDTMHDGFALDTPDTEALGFQEGDIGGENNNSNNGAGQSVPPRNVGGRSAPRRSVIGG